MAYLFQLQVIKAGDGQYIFSVSGQKFHNNLSAYFNSSALRENKTFPHQENTSFQIDTILVDCPPSEAENCSNVSNFHYPFYLQNNNWWKNTWQFFFFF